MRVTKLNIFIACLLLVVAAIAGIGRYLSGVRMEQPAYLTLAPTLPPMPPGKIEVVEFFWYGCPHCRKYEPVLEAWARKHADKVTLRRVPAGLHEKQVPQQKMYYAFDKLGRLDEMHRVIFDYVHVGNKALSTDENIGKFAQSHQVSKEQWQAVYDSASVQARVHAATQLQRDYKAERVPSVVIGGRYVTSPSMVGMTLPYLGQTDEMRYQAVEKLMDELLLKVQHERNML